MKGKESKRNHRKSLAWDTAFFTNHGVLDPEELFGSLKIDENGVNHTYSVNTLLPTETNARPSFAWDNAFFTDPGVLDAEELSLVNNGFTSNTQLRKSADDSMTTITQGSRFSVSSIESDLFHDLRASLRNSSNVKQPVTRESQRKLPDSKKRTKGYNKRKDQPFSLIPQPKVFSSSSSSSISKTLTPCQTRREKKCVAASELGKGKHKNHGFEEQSGSKSNIRSSYSRYAVKDLTTISSSGLRLPLPKMCFFDSKENEEKENREPNAVEASRRRRHKSKLETSSSTQENRSILGQRKMRK
ncbi:PREDICTED: uncharacterized protein LOC104785561 [Camelina sativa]|uniref:Uncharacterized protein LOC104785561 n=1 Tax=Camelina sativa TaxID=90675 RepID=A0ABM1RQG3_CAMSA|nr:PREDICTED: uncharacterized protein LOC104785561 [Camelina sativa]